MTRRDYEFLARSLRLKREVLSQEWAKGASISEAAHLLDRERQFQVMEDYLVETLSSGDATFKEVTFREASHSRLKR